MSILDLQRYEYNILEENTHDIYFQLIPLTPKPSKCHSCGHDELYAHGKRTQQYMDLPIRSKRVGHEIDVKRYRCRACNKITQLPLPDMSEKYRMTNRLVTYIQKYALHKPFTHIAEEIGISEGTVRNIFNDYVSILEKEHKFETPKVMGIDEIHLAKKPRCVITNIEKRSIIEMLKDRNKLTVQKYLSNLDNPHVILNVAMDMWRPYRDSVKEILPDATIVIDKFHVVRMANDALEKCRKSIRKSLKQRERIDMKNDRYVLLKREHELTPHEQFLLSYWKGKYPLLSQTYDLKEAFYSIYDAKDKVDAYDRYESWESQLAEDVKPFFANLHKAVTNWHNEIFGYFDNPITNAYTESVNSLIRLIDRKGRSYSFDSIRAKVLYMNQGFHAKTKPKFNRRFSKSIMTDDIMMSKMPYFNDVEEDVNYGVSIDKLIRAIESGEFEI